MMDKTLTIKINTQDGRWPITARLSAAFRAARYIWEATR